MTVLLIRHFVASFDAWKVTFDEDAAMRQAHGSWRERVFRDSADANQVLLYLDWDDDDRAELFARSSDFRDTMVRAGVTDHPDVWILKEVDRPAS